MGLIELISAAVIESIGLIEFVGFIESTALMKKQVSEVTLTSILTRGLELPFSYYIRTDLRHRLAG